MENLAKDYTHIKGWGMDADPKNDPTYPIKHRTNEEHKGYTWERPTQQPVTTEVLHSIERPNITAVFGTPLPPRGLSGRIRRYAFKFSENSYVHWLPLLLADRVDEIEGVIDDLRQGRVPNVFAERGWKAQIRHNPKAVATKVVIGLLLATAAVSYLRRDKE